MELESISLKEKRDSTISVRLPNSSLSKVKSLAKKYKRSQSEIIEHAIKMIYNYELNKSKKEQ